MPTSELQFRTGAGRLCLDFIRTLRHRGRPDAVEELPTADRLDAWFRQLGLCQPHVTDPDRDRDARARELREQIHLLIAAALGPGGVTSCPAPARRQVNAAAASPVPAPYLDSHGQLRYRADRPATAALALIARDCLDLICSAELARLRRCGNPDCRVLFVDRSRPGARRWCSMKTCGNQAKKAAQRARGRTGS